MANSDEVSNPETAQTTGGAETPVAVVPEVKPYVKRERTWARDPKTGRILPEADSAERRRLSVEMLERGATLSEVGRAYWSGDRSTAKREVERWYAENPNPDALTLRRVMTGKLAGLEGIVRDVMAKDHFVVDKGSVVLDATGQPLIDDKPIYEGVDRILRIGEQLIKITPGVAAPKVVAEIPLELLDGAIAEAREMVMREAAELAREEGNDGDG